MGEFRELGFLPDALFNFLALLGWAPGDDREIMSRQEMAGAFDFAHCKASPARFDIKKLTWMNGEYIAKQPREAFTEAFDARLAAAGLPHEPLNGLRADLLDQIQPRTKTYADIPANCVWFFAEEYPFDEKAVNKRLHAEGVPALLDEVAAAIEAAPDFTVESLEALVRAMGEAKGCGLGGLVHPIRVAVSGRGEGPGLFETLWLLGRDRTLRRLRGVAQRLREGTL